MKKDKPIDYSMMTQIAGFCGMIPFTDRHGKVIEGQYTLKGFHAPVDLSACAEDEKSIFRTALQQLSEQADENQRNTSEETERGQ